ncbi:hypothetical protein [Catenuloplanes japonicus]|uniref:hypothetical protein n=1 Tax=Catenuloplanes japonicus TaxID=33876 RepID=UPI0005252668|nr:hypothetical protein [Catenuloplanes japonicus]
MQEQTPHEPTAPINGHSVPDLLISGGDATPTPQPAGGTRSARASRWRARLRLDTFGLRALAALGAAGVFASLITEWQRYDLPADSPEFDIEDFEPILVQLDQFGAIAFGYLGAVIALAGCAALALFGRASGRSQARVLGLSMAGAALACAAAVLMAGDSETVRVGGLIYSTGGTTMEISTQPGAWYGVGGTVLLALAVFLVPHPRELPPVLAAGPEVDPDSDEWRQPVVPRHADERPAAPLDLSVEPVEPFRFNDERREPWR